jgi:hypothetical protein
MGGFNKNHKLSSAAPSYQLVKLILKGRVYQMGEGTRWGMAVL